MPRARAAAGKNIRSVAGDKLRVIYPTGVIYYV
jgi:hypothetical protein